MDLPAGDPSKDKFFEAKQGQTRGRVHVGIREQGLRWPNDGPPRMTDAVRSLEAGKLGIGVWILQLLRPAASCVHHRTEKVVPAQDVGVQAPTERFLWLDCLGPV
jgi:hypothetical protein